MTTPQAPHSLLSKSPLFRVLLGIGFFSVALVGRLTMPVDGSLPFVTFYPATVLAFYLCGVGPGALMAVLSACSGYYIFSTPSWSWMSDWKGVVALASYSLFSILVGWLVGKLQASFDALRVALVKLRETSDDLQDLYDGAPCAYYSLDANGRYLQANAVAMEMIGHTHEQAIGILGPAHFYSQEGREFFARQFEQFKVDGKIGPAEFDLMRDDGTVRRVVMSATVVNDDAGQFVKTRSVMCDISELHTARQNLERLARQQQAMLDNELVGIVKLRDRRAIWNNRALELMFGYDIGELNHCPARRLYADDVSFAAIGEAGYSALARGETYRTQILMARKNGEPMWVDMSGMLLNEVTGESLWMMLDITIMKQQHAEVEMLAFHDSLTGLPNRLLLDKLLSHSLYSAQRGAGSLAVCFLDLNNFKEVNDRFGHAAGDRLLKAVAARLRDVTRGSDIVARLGGDEFVLVLTALESREQYHEVAGRVLSVIGQPVALDTECIVAVSASLGAAFFPEDGRDTGALLRIADEAMYAMKNGKHMERASKAG